MISIYQLNKNFLKDDKVLYTYYLATTTNNNRVSAFLKNTTWWVGWQFYFASSYFFLGYIGQESDFNSSCPKMTIKTLGYTKN